MLIVGLEKTLKFSQFSSQIIATLSQSSVEAARWNSAKATINTARRFFRLFKWIDCFNAALAQFNVPASTASTKPSHSKTEKSTKSETTQPEQDSIKLLLSVSKWSLIGIYLFLEMFVITDAVGLTVTTWSGPLQIEALKLWAYALAVSVLLGLYELFTLPAPAVPDSTKPQTRSTVEKNHATSPEAKEQRVGDGVHAKRRAIYKQLAADISDIVIPAQIAGWLPADALTMGVAGSINGLLGAHSAWERVNK